MRLGDHGITATPWTPAVADALRDVLPGHDLELVAGECAGGVAQVWQSTDDGVLVTRLERYPTHTELVLVAGAGARYRHYVGVFVEYARACGIDRVRTHVSRPGLCRLLTGLGFDQGTTEFSIDLNDGQ